MLKKLLLIVLLAMPACLFAQVDTTSQSSSQSAPVPAKFGYLSYSEIFKAMPEYAMAQENMSVLKAKYDAEVKRSDEEFNKKYAEFLQDQKNFPQSILLRRQKELQQLMERGIDFKNETKALLNEASQKMEAPIYEKLNEALKAVGQQYGLEYILNTDNNAFPFINLQFGADVTQLVKDKLGIK